MSSLFNAEERAGLKLLNLGVNDVIWMLRHAEKEGALASCCVAADAPLLEELKLRYGVEMPIPGDTLDPELQSPEDAIVVIRPHPDHPIGENGLAMVALDIKLFAMSTEV